MAKKFDWTALGIVWHDDEIVKTDDGETSHRATLPEIVDLDKVEAWLGKERVTAMLNLSNSPRVAAQAMNRRAALSNPAKGFDWVKEQFHDYAEGLRASVRVIVRIYPDGERYTGTDEVEFRNTFAAKLFDMGVPIEKAKEKAAQVQW